jgi:hypothetical protein
MSWGVVASKSMTQGVNLDGQPRSQSTRSAARRESQGHEPCGAAKHRYAYLLWEFWKKDTELFPAEIMRSQAGVREKPHCILLVFDGSLDEIPNGEEETAFYRDIIQMSLRSIACSSVSFSVSLTKSSRLVE